MYLDLEYQSRTDSNFQSRLKQLQAQLAQYYEAALRDSTRVKQFQQALTAAFQHCNFNSVFLTPYFWSHYPTDQPLSYADYPFAWPLFGIQFGGFMVIRGSRQISKSTSFCCRQQMHARLIPGFRSMYIVPRNQQLKTYSNKMCEIERAIVGSTTKRSSILRQNLNYKEFPNGSTVELAYVLTSASPVRGKSADELLFDETQDFDPDLELEVSQIQSASTRPVTIYAGTSLTTDTLLEKKWSESSQGYWVTRCEACRHENYPLPTEGALDMIQPNGPACIKCGRPLNVRLGRFIHTHLNLVNVGRLGFHVPQIIIPAVVNNPVRWAKIHELKVKQGGDRKFMQEVLGIAVEEGEREITRKNLMDICILGRDLQQLRNKAVQGGYQYVVSGCDWGGSDYNPSLHTKLSTTVHVILGVLPGIGKLDILHMRRYGGMNYDDIVQDILRNHQAYGGKAIASDFGVGAVYNSKIREMVPPEQHLIFNYTGPVGALIAEPRKAHMYNQWSLNKTESISMTFDAIRQQRIRCFSWEFAEEYLVDCLNLYRAPGERTGAGGAGAGNSAFLYRGHPSKPNDTLMAINYAHMLSKIMLGEPMFADQTLKLRLEQSLRSDIVSLYRNLPGAISE